MKLTNPLMFAAKDGDLNKLKTLLTQMDVNTTEEDGATPFMVAIAHGQIDAAKFLLQNGANPTLCDIEGRNAVNLAVMFEKPEALQFLMSIKDKYDLDIDNQTLDGNRKDKSPLMQAIELTPSPKKNKTAFANYLEMIKMLLKAGANVDLTDTRGHSVWTFATKSPASNKILEVLHSEFGFNDETKLFFEHIENENLKELENILKHHKNPKLLLSQIDPDSGKTPLNLVSLTNLKMTKLFLRYGADMHQVDKQGFSPYQQAATISQPALLRIFKKLNISIQEDEKKLVEQTQRLSRLNQVLGVESRTTVSYRGQPKKGLVASGGNYIEDSLIILNDINSVYLKAIEHEPMLFSDFSSIDSAFKLANDFANKKSNRGIPEMLKSFNQHQLVILPSGWEGHTIGVGILKMDTKEEPIFKLIANRGESAKKSGTNIYPVKKENSQDINSEHLNDIVAPLQLVDINKNEILPKIYDYISDLKHPFAAPHTKKQGHDTCTFVNMKALILLGFYILMVQRLTKALETNDEKILKEFQEKYGVSIKTEDDIKGVSLEYAKSEYKKYTLFMRNHEIKGLIQSYKEAKSTEEKKFYRSLLSDYLIQHHGQERYRKKRTKKIQEEVVRFQWIMDALTDEDKKWVIKKCEARNAALLVPAAKVGNAALVNTLLKFGADPFRVNRLGETPLSVALELQHKSCIEPLLEIYKKEIKSFQTAIQHGHVKVLNILFNEEKFKTWILTETNYLRMIQHAIRFNNKDSLEFLLSIYPGKLEKKSLLIKQIFEMALKDKRELILIFLYNTKEIQEYLQEGDNTQKENKTYEFLEAIFEKASIEFIAGFLKFNRTTKLQSDIELFLFEKAIESGRNDLIKLMVSYKSNINFINNPLHEVVLINKCKFLIEQDNVIGFKHIFKNCSQPLLKEKMAFYSFFECLTNHHTAALKLVISHKSVVIFINDPLNENKMMNYLKDLVIHKKNKMVQLLLNALDKTNRNKFLITTFKNAIERTNSPLIFELVKFPEMVDFINDPNNQGEIQKALHRLMMFEKGVAMESILNNIKEQAVKKSFITPLILNAFKGNVDVSVHFLLKYKEAKDFLKDISHEKLFKECIETLITHNSVDLIMLLIQNVDPKIQDRLKLHAFVEGCKKGNLLVAESLIDDKGVVEALKNDPSIYSSLLKDADDRQDSYMKEFLEPLKDELNLKTRAGLKR